VAARQAHRANRDAEAGTQHEHIVADHPRLFEAQARLGRAFVERGEHEKYLHWDRALPPEASGHPEIWVTRGFFAEGRGERRVAIRCFGEAVRLHPDHVTACYRLSQLLAAEGLAQNATLFGLRAQRLARLESLLNEVRSEFALPMVHEVVETLSDLGRNWEAAGWSHLALRVDPALPWALRRLRAFRATTAKFVLTPDEANPARRIDLSRYPLPQPPGMRQSDQPSQLAAGRSSDIRFENSADEAGLDFRYFNGADPASGRAYMFEFSGGGAAVLDYDGDAWPDLYLTQGCPWPVGERSHGFRDLLYRNLGNGRFAEVPAGAAAADAGFGQGAAPGDFNNDGFPDLYVANIGANRLFVNNGDGTFSDVTAQSATGGGDRWTTSSVLADFNGDGAPDIYAVNYLAAPEVFEKVCEDGGRPVQCAPTMFAAEQDRLFLNNGDGTFRDATETSGIVAPDGKGLGVVAADFDDSGRLSLFVANDTTANFFFQNRVPSPRVTTRGLQDGPLFEEQALLSGLALDGHGHAQACMGIAVDDADGDGRLDLFVTNFYGESNVLYFQPAAGMFSDETAASGLREPSHFSLGFGTQFLDADLDGWPDLIVTNGHINDFTASGTPYQMRPQFFRNRGRGKFAEVAADELGPYFQHKYLGRALARLDWNRDGLDDACVTHVDAPVALLTNRTSGGGHSLRLRFSARQSARDAIGTTVRIANGGREAVRQLTAGGGFEAANQPQLTIGLGDEPQAERVIVRWPSGTEQEFHDLAAGAEWLVIEGDARPWRLPR
ncbi:MAG: VCBS repeat-containing protein, partial [Planctomycetes bacterium]|nr:VCBS repeat-containing protein [Planctomycetota bacterium]